MKVRWTPRSVRFRITPTEMQCLRMGASVDSILPVPGGSWSVVIEPADATDIGMIDGVLRVGLAARDLDALAEVDREGVYFLSEHETPIRYYVEKDFPCVHPRPPAAAEPASETFTAPTGFKLRHKTDCQ